MDEVKLIISNDDGRDILSLTPAQLSELDAVFYKLMSDTEVHYWCEQPKSEHGTSPTLYEDFS